jgi:hypothetical protein
MNDEQLLPGESSNYRPGEPLRSWTSGGESVAPFDAEVAIAASEALGPLRRLLDGDELSDADLIAFGRLNSHCVLRWYEPLVSLIRGPEIPPEVIEFLRDSVPGLER